MKTRSERPLAWRRLRRNWAVLVGGGVLTVIAAGAVLADLIAIEPVSYFDIRLAQLPPGTDGRLFGTDDLGRDVFSRVVRGSRISVGVAFAAVAVAALGGALLGLVAGSVGRWSHAMSSRRLDALLALLGLLLVPTVLAALGPGLNSAMIALGVGGIPWYAPVMRATTLSTHESTSVRAACTVGIGNMRVMFRPFSPNVISPILVVTSLGLGISVLVVAGLGFFGWGANPPDPEWGLELATTRGYFRTAWWIPTFNGLAVATTVLATIVFAVGLRKSLDPQAFPRVR